MDVVRTSPDSAQRESAVHAIQQIALIQGNQDVLIAIPVLLVAKHSDAAGAVRNTAATALRTIGTGADAVPHYFTLGSSPNEAVRREVFGVLAQFVGTATTTDLDQSLPIDRLVDLKPHLQADWQAADQFIRLLATYATRLPRVEPAVVRTLQSIAQDIAASPPPNLGFQTLGLCMDRLAALGGVGFRAMLDLVPRLHIAYVEVPLSVAARNPSTLTQNQEIRDKAVAVTIQVLSYPNTDSYVCRIRYSAAALLRTIGPSAAPATPYLRAILTDPQKHGFGDCGQAGAASALAAIGG